MMLSLRPRAALVMPLVLAVMTIATACHEPHHGLRSGISPLVAPQIDAIAKLDLERTSCQQQLALVGAEADLGGTPAFDEQRAAILGRASGEPIVLVRAPASTANHALPEDVRRARGATTSSTPPAYVSRWRTRFRHQPDKLRQLVLREGYLYSEDPVEAFWLVRKLTVADLFDDNAIWLARGETKHRLERDGSRYLHRGGERNGEPAKLLFGDRLANDETGLERPLHRDFRALRRRIGFDRAQLLHRTPKHLIARLRFAGQWTLALLASDGASLSLSCFDTDRQTRANIEQHVRNTDWRRRATTALNQAVDSAVREQLPFDRPRGVSDHFSDGQLRPQWRWAYQRGANAFSHDEKTYFVFDRKGRPAPPQMCVEFILDSFERASGTWYRPRGETPQRNAGELDFNLFGLNNRAGVLAFERFAQRTPSLFESSRFETRIPFRERARFFAFLRDDSDRFLPGDVLAIQGEKADGYIHQHAILVTDVDPMTGFPYGLADQMRVPRRRTWEAIMAEAPKRSLLYQVRPRPEMLSRLHQQHDTSISLR